MCALLDGMHLCWKSPLPDAETEGVQMQGEGDPRLQKLGLDDRIPIMCKDRLSGQQEMIFPLVSGPMGNFIPGGTSVSIAGLDSASKSDEGDELGRTSDDDVGENTMEEAAKGSAEADGVMERQVTVDGEAYEDSGADIFLDELMLLLDEQPPNVDNVPAVSNLAQNYLPPLPVQWDLALGARSVTDASGTVKVDSSANHNVNQVVNGIGPTPGNTGNIPQEPTFSSHEWPLQQKVMEHGRFEQTNGSVRASEWEQAMTSSHSDFVNETSGGLSPCSDMVESRKPEAACNEDDNSHVDGALRRSSASAEAMSSRSPTNLSSMNLVDLTEVDSSDGEVFDDQDEEGSSEQPFGKRKVPDWLVESSKKRLCNTPTHQQNLLMASGQERSENQPVDLSVIKAEARVPHVWNTAKAVASVPRDLLNRQIAAAGQSFRLPCSSKPTDAGYRFILQRNPNEHFERYDTGGARNLSFLTPTASAQAGGLVSRLFAGQSTSPVLTRGQSGTTDDETTQALHAVLRGFADGVPSEEASLDEGLMTVPLLKHQKIALGWMAKRECVAGDLPVGGILADDQGLGKTISMISLILKLRPPSRKTSSEAGPPLQLEAATVHIEEDDVKCLPTTQVPCMPSDGLELVEVDKPDCHPVGFSPNSRPAAGTLVVCPTSVLRQWANEIKTRVSEEAALKYVIYHGSNRIRDPKELAKYDVVLTTYCILSMEVPLQPSAEEQEEERRNLSEYGLSHFGQPKVSKVQQKSDKGKKKSRVRCGDGQDASAAQSGAGPLARVAWFRVILDEAQSIKNGKTQVARAAWGLRAKRRWCLSGTPIQNSIDDLYSYFRFLRYSPYDKFNHFRQSVKDPISRNPSQGYLKLQSILRGILLRRTKATLIDGEPIVKLPPRVVQLVQTEFSIEERSFYTCLENESRKQFQVYAAAGTVQNNYVNILWMLLRLRQACDHRQLVKGLSSQTAQQSTIHSCIQIPDAERIRLLALVAQNVGICSICNDALEEPVVTSCSHVFCQQCILQHLGTGDDSSCPFPKCRKALKASQVYSVAALNGNSTSIEGASETQAPRDWQVSATTEREGDWASSSKIDAVVNTLLALPRLQAETAAGQEEGFSIECANSLALIQTGLGKEEESSPAQADRSASKDAGATEKAIVFSQWTSMLDLLEIPLKSAGFNYRRLDGTMTVNARDRAVLEFNTLPEVNVIIMSLKAASLGLNMVAASHVLLMDVWWNPTTEDQAIDRAHRIGQTRMVKVSRFTIKNTIEDRILALQDRKRQMVASAFGETELGEQRTRLTEQDLRYLFRV